MEIGLNTMNFKTAKRIFEHTLDCESRVSTAINLGLLKLINMELIESTSQLVGETISSGNRVWMTSDLHFLHANIIRYSNRPFYNVGDMTGAHLQLLQKVPADDLDKGDATLFHLAPAAADRVAWAPGSGQSCHPAGQQNRRRRMASLCWRAGVAC